MTGHACVAQRMVAMIRPSQNPDPLPSPVVITYGRPFATPVGVGGGMRGCVGTLVVIVIVLKPLEHIGFQELLVSRATPPYHENGRAAA